MNLKAEFKKIVKWYLWLIGVYLVAGLFAAGYFIHKSKAKTSEEVAQEFKNFATTLQVWNQTIETQTQEIKNEQRKK